MLPFLIEAIAICLLFPVSCIFLVRRIMEHLEPAKPNHWAEIVQRLIDLGMISGVDTPHGFRQGDISHV